MPDTPGLAVPAETAYIAAMQQDVRSRPDIEIVPDAPSDPDDFLRWASTKPREHGKYELSRGRVTHLMINVTQHHNRICTNIMLALGRVIDLDAYDLGSADFGVRTPFGVRGPDIFIAPRGTDGKALSTDKAIFVAEVLSPSTKDLDFGEKRDEYLAMPTLQTYVLFSQDEPTAWIYSRRPDRTWPVEPEIVHGRTGSILIGGIAAFLDMAAIYRGV